MVRCRLSSAYLLWSAQLNSRKCLTNSFEYNAIWFLGLQHLFMMEALGDGYSNSAQVHL